MGLEDFKDWLFDVLNELSIVGGSMFAIECREL